MLLPFSHHYSASGYLYPHTFNTNVAFLHSSLQRTRISISPHIQHRCCFPSFITAAHQDIYIPTHSTQMLLFFVHHCSAPGYLYPHTFNTNVAFLHSSLQCTRISISPHIQHRCCFPSFITAAHQDIYIPTHSTQMLLFFVHHCSAPGYLYPHTFNTNVAFLHSSLQCTRISISPHIQHRCCFPSFITAAHQDIYIPTHSTQMLLSFIHHCSAPGYLYPHTFNTDVAFLPSSLQRTRISISPHIQHRCCFSSFITAAHQDIYIHTHSTQMPLPFIHHYSSPEYLYPHTFNAGVALLRLLLWCTCLFTPTHLMQMLSFNLFAVKVHLHTYTHMFMF